MINLLLRQKPFSVLLGGSLISRIGDGVHELVFVLAALKVTGNEISEVGIIYFFRFIPYLLLGPIGGVLSDRLSRKFLMLAADLARTLVTGGFCALLVTDQINAVWLALLSMLMTGFRTLFQPAFQAAVPSLLPSRDLPSANGAIEIASELGGLAGPALGGILLALIPSPGRVLMLDAATFLLSALCVAIVRIPRDHVAQAARSLTLRSLYGEFWQNLVRVRHESQLCVTIAYSSACIFLVGAALRIMIPAMMTGAGFSGSQVGYAISLIALGAIAGVALCGRIARDFSTRSLMVYWCLYGLALSLLPYCVTSLATILAGCFVLGVFGAFVDVVLPTNIQSMSGNVNIGKNFGLFSTLANTGEALSGSFAGMLVLLSSVGVSVTVIGLLTASVAYVGKLRAAGQHE